MLSEHLPFESFESRKVFPWAKPAPNRKEEHLTRGKVGPRPQGNPTRRRSYHGLIGYCEANSLRGNAQSKLKVPGGRSYHDRNRRDVTEMPLFVLDLCLSGLSISRSNDTCGFWWFRPPRHEGLQLVHTIKYLGKTSNPVKSLCWVYTSTIILSNLKQCKKLGQPNHSNCRVTRMRSTLRLRRCRRFQETP